MTNRIRDASKKSEVGRPKTEDRNRHGPSTRGDPDIRGKPPMGIGVSNSNITDLESPPPGTVISTKERSLSNKVAVNNMRFLSCFLRSPLGGKPEGKGARSWLQWESRVLAAKNNVGFFGNFIPNRDCYGKEEAPPNLPQGEEQEKREGGRPETEDRKKSQLADCHLEGGTTERSLSNKVAQSGMRFLSAFGMTATGKTTRLAVRNRLTHILQTSEMTEKENVEYRMMNNEYRSLKKSGVRRRKTEESHSNPTYVTSVGRQSQFSEWVSWFPNRDYKCAKWNSHHPDEEKNRSLSTQYIKNNSLSFKNEKNPEGKRGQKNNTINKVSITGMRFRVEPGMTETGKTTRLAVTNRLTHITQPSQLTNDQ